MLNTDSQLYEEVFKQPNLSLIAGFKSKRENKLKQQKLFETNQIRNPKLTHYNLVDYDIDKVISFYEDILSKEIQSEYNSLYQSAIRNLLTSQKILRTSMQSDWTKFMEHNFVYFGKVDNGLWSFTQYQLEKLLDEAEEYPDLKTPIEYLRDHIDFKYNKSIVLEIEGELNQELPESIIRNIQLRCESRNSIKENSSYTTQEMIPIFENALEEYRILDWDIELDNNYEGITVSSSKRIVYLPKNKSYEGSYLKRLIPHEIGVHVQRSFNSYQSNYQIIKYGRLSNLEEEGLAKVVENTLYESKSEISTSFLAVGLALGMDGTKRDFRDLYEILIRYYQILNTTRQKEINIKNQAWSRSIKTYMGTDYKTPGVCFLRTKGYLEKELYTRQYLLKNQDSFEFIMNNKYDYLNNQLDTDLKTLIRNSSDTKP
jgi:hypothetical protein